MQKIAESKIDTIVGSELAYDKDDVKRLMKTISHFLALNPQLKIMISFQKNKEQWKNFETCFKEHVGVQYRLIGWN